MVTHSKTASWHATFQRGYSLGPRNDLCSRFTKAFPQSFTHLKGIEELDNPLVTVCGLHQHISLSPNMLDLRGTQCKWT